ncbi:subtilisin-like protease SBT3 [Mercurialis annua]|uniref:subtilisin-like protease SBT3 n=1 Tax=Mercurialis annua TaxID=3986 RepID=UPI0021609B97|nr:subtilisin-like protease SBT3 [Mercurialis annua]
MTKHCKFPSFVWLLFTASNLLLFFIPLLLAEKENYIVHMDLSAMPKAFSDHHSWHLATLDSVFQLSKTTDTINNEAKPSTLLYSYTHVMHGFSAHLSPAEHEILKSSPGFVSSIKDKQVKPDTTRSPSFLGLTSTSEAWNVSNYGEGIIIGVIDSGVWPESESFSDEGMPKVPKRWKGKCESGTEFSSSLCNNKLIGARFYNKGVIAHKNVTITMNSTRDTYGHGTHTSSIAAGNFVKGASYFGYAPGTASGVAPRAHVAMYKALWEDYGASYTSDVIAAIDQAIMDGVDVLSISVGYGNELLYEDPIALATFAAAEKDIFVATSAGNDGPHPGTLHNGVPWVTTVGAGTIDREFNGILNLGNGVSVSGMSLYPGNDTTTWHGPIAFNGNCFDDRRFKKGHIIVCEEKYGGMQDLEEQYDNIRLSDNIIGGIFITKVVDLENFIQTRIPTIFINLEDGKKIKSYIKSSTKPNASMEFKKTILGVKSAPSLATYSSRGPDLSCQPVLKPDITAPGSRILAAWPDNIWVDLLHNEQEIYTNYNLLSGTSMACPHVAGVAALLKKAHPDWSHAAIRSAMMTTADTMTRANKPIIDLSYDRLPATPTDMGSGYINPNKALHPGLIYDAKVADYVSFLCALNLTQQQIQTFTRSAHNNCSFPSSSDLNYPSFIAYFNADDSEANLTTVQEYHRTVTNVGDAVSTYTANLTPIPGIKVSVVPNKLVFKTKYQKLSYKLTIKGPKAIPQNIVHGYLTWTDSKIKYVVKSPIAVIGQKDFYYDDD